MASPNSAEANWRNQASADSQTARDYYDSNELMPGVREFVPQSAPSFIGEKAGPDLRGLLHTTVRRRAVTNTQQRSTGGFNSISAFMENVRQTNDALVKPKQKKLKLSEPTINTSHNPLTAFLKNASKNQITITSPTSNHTNISSTAPFRELQSHSAATTFVQIPPGLFSFLPANTSAELDSKFPSLTPQNMAAGHSSSTPMSQIDESKFK